MSGEPFSAELRQVLRDLKLSGVLDTWPERVELARQAPLPYPEFLTDTLADEVARPTPKCRCGGTAHCSTRKGKPLDGSTDGGDSA